MVVFGLGKDHLFNSVLGHCVSGTFALKPRPFDFLAEFSLPLDG